MSVQDQTQLRKIKGIGAKRAESILTMLSANHQSLDDLFKMDAEAIRQKFKLPASVAQALADYHPSTQTVQTPLQWSEKPGEGKDIRLLLAKDQSYPQHLADVLGKKAPSELHVWGNLELLNRPAVGFCGSRNVSETGLKVTADTVQQLVEAGCVIVSGHARGVDITAHRTALECGGATIIVLAEGIKDFKLRQEIRKFATRDNVLVISEFKPDAVWTVGRAMTRNNTIIGLSNAMVLIESRLEGGTFNAGKTALKLKVPIFVTEYENTTPGNEGNRYFLQHGAIALRKSGETGRANIIPLKSVVFPEIQDKPGARKTQPTLL